VTLEAVEIKGFVESSLIEWPGRLAAVIFLPGCNLRCRYCHARDLVLGAASVESIPAEKVLDYAGSSGGWIDGIVISGGEPTLYAGLAGLMRDVKSRGLDVKLDTNGTRPDVIAGLMDEGLVDAVAMDVKAPLDERYLKVANVPVDLARVRESIRLIMQSGIEYEFRTTVSPALLSLADVVDVAREIEGARRYCLQPFCPHVCLDEEFERHPQCPRSYLEHAAALAKGFVGEVVIRTA